MEALARQKKIERAMKEATRRAGVRARRQARWDLELQRRAAQSTADKQAALAAKRASEFAAAQAQLAAAAAAAEAQTAKILKIERRRLTKMQQVRAFWCLLWQTFFYYCILLC